MVGPGGRRRASSAATLAGGSPSGVLGRLPLAPTLTLALIGLTLVLAVIAALGIGNLYSARQDYEDALARTYELESAASRLLASAVIEETGFRATGAGAAATRGRARAGFDQQALEAMALAEGDRESEQLLRDRVASQQRARRLARRNPRSRGAQRRLAEAIFLGREAGEGLMARQRERRGQARDSVGDRTRTALITTIAAGGLALLGAIGLIGMLIGSIRRPLDELVTATQKLAAGDLSERVQPSGPLELRELDSAFNTMAERLERAQTGVEAEREKLAVTIESLGDALVVCESDGTVSTVNPRVKEIAPALRPGGHAHVAGSPLPALEEALNGEVTVDNDGRTLSITAARLGSGASDGVVWTLRDVSERARLERVKSDFVATASHELRSPLTSIKGFVELLGSSDSLGPREREFVDVILLSTDRLVDLVNDLLDVARLEAGRMEVHPRLFELIEVVTEVAGLMAPAVAAKRQRLDLDLPASMPRALADPARVRQIVTNLLSNAHQYTDEGGRIEIAARADEERIRITVGDDGRGMSREDLGSVFDRFVRHDDGGAGTGLGLSIVKSLVDLQGGSIEVDSVLGVGTTFTVYLPAESGQAGALGEPVRGKCVLVAGRSSARGRLEPALVELGLDHEWVASGTAAVQASRHRHYELALVDVGMRGTDALLRGPALARTVLLFSAGIESPAMQTDGEVLPLEQVAAAARKILIGGPGPA